MSPFYLALPSRLDQNFCNQLEIVLAYSQPVAAMMPLEAIRDDEFMKICVRQLHENECAVLVGVDPSHVEKAMKLMACHDVDGLHLTSATDYARIRKDLDKRLMAGAFCGTSRHEAMLVGESGADYIAYGTPYTRTRCAGSLQKDIEMTKWLSEIIETPNVFWEAHSANEVITFLDHGADFVAFGTYLWESFGSSRSLRAGTELLPPPCS